MAQIKEVLVDFNPWWKEEYKVEFKDREIYPKIRKFLGLPQIVAFTGLRRVGKTTIMLKIAADSIKEGFDAKDIIYFSFDEFKSVEIRQVITEYEKLMGNDFRKGKYLLLLDEIQKLEGWEEQLKSIYDISGKRVKIIISGSESLFIRKKSKETLAGRLFEFKIDLLTFKEFISFKGVKFTPARIYGKELLRLFDEFTLTSGFPELVGIKDKEIIKKYVDEGIIKKVIYQDISKMFRINGINQVESLLNIFREEPGQLIDLSELAGELKVSRQTLANYLTYLEKSFLMLRVYNFSKNRRKIERKLKKYYPTTISADLLFKEDILSKSRVFEWLIVTQLKAEFFWRDPYKNEVDIVLADKKIIPIEVKYGKIDISGLLAFMDKFGIDKGVVISYNQREEKRIKGKTIQIIPAFEYLME